MERVATRRPKHDANLRIGCNRYLYSCAIGQTYLGVSASLHELEKLAQTMGSKKKEEEEEAADAVVVPSHGYGNGIAIATAMAMILSMATAMAMT